MLAKGSGLGCKRLGLLGAALKQLGTGTGNAGNIHVAYVRNQVARQFQQIVTFLDLRANKPIELGDITIGNGARKLAQNLVRNFAQKRAGIVRMHGAVAEDAQLLQRGKRVAHAALGMACHDGKRLVVVVEALLLAHVCQAALDILVTDAVEIEALAAREDCLQNLLRVGGAQHKDHVRRRLLERLEQRVKRRRREHVDLVDDIDLVLAAHRGKVDGVDDLLAHIVYAGTACGIELVDIWVVALGDELTLLAGTVGHAAACTLGARRLGIAAQQRLGKNTRHGGLARAARSAEQVGVGQAPLGDGVLERRDDMLLAHHGVEGERAILSVQRFHGCSPGYTESCCRGGHAVARHTAFIITRTASPPR